LNDSRKTERMHILFLPGAGGAAEFWHALGAALPAEWAKTYFSWPGLGNQPHDPTVNSFADLVALVETAIKGPVVIVAQSMGGIVAVQLALRHPENITHLVLVATSGGVDVAGLGGAEWREAYLQNFPDSRTWITEERPDHTSEIPKIACPTLLIWGDNDPVSPVAVGCHLSALMPHAVLRLIEGGNHDLGRERASEIAPWIVQHVTTAPQGKSR
jgi:pimeloyl-ACP methyl ester carboxylesterase